MDALLGGLTGLRGVNLDQGVLHFHYVESG